MLRVGTTKIQRENDELVRSCPQFERVTISSFLCLGRAKSHSSGEQLPGQPALHGVLGWGVQLLTLTICAHLESPLRRKRKMWGTEERCGSNKKWWVVFRTYQPQFSAHFCEIPIQIMSSAPRKILIHEEGHHEGPKGKSPFQERVVAGCVWLPGKPSLTTPCWESQGVERRERKDIL